MRFRFSFFRIPRKLVFFLIILVPVLIILGLSGEIVVRTRYPVACMNLRLDEMPFEASGMLRHVWKDQAAKVHIRKATIPINSLGYRGPEFDRAKAPGRYRIIIYGGSQVFDMNIGGCDDWPHRLEKRLHELGFPAIEVINAGVPGNTSWEAAAWLLGEGHRFHPDLVILCNEWNELSYLSSTEALLRHFGPFDVRDNPQLYSVNFADRLLSRYSCLYRGFRYRFLQWKLGLGAEGSRKTDDHRLLQDEAFEQYRLNLEEFVDLAHRVGAGVFLILQPRLPVPSAGKDVRAMIKYDVHNLSHEQLCDAFERMDEILRGLGREDGVELLSSASAMSGRVEFFEDHIHFNDAGSRKMADLLAHELAIDAAFRALEMNSRSSKSVNAMNPGQSAAPQ